MEKTGTIVIEWVTDAVDDEIYGRTYADGAVVYLNGKIILDRLPVANSQGKSIDYTPQEIIHELMEKLGYDTHSCNMFTGVLEKEQLDDWEGGYDA